MINHQLEESKKQLAEAEAQLQSLKNDLQKKVVVTPKQLNKPTLAKIGQLYNQENIEKLAVEHPVIAELQKEMVTKPEEEVELPALGSAASDSPYN